VLDERHTYPDTYASFAPNHFLVSGWFFKPLLKILLPARRPMDNMAAGWDCPQEDEFALCNMGMRSPYLTFAFPNRPPQDQQYLDFEGVAPLQVARWKAALHWFLQCVTVQHPKRIVLKSPPHTGRIKVLLELFPGARFIHIVRNPYAIFPSTVKLWKHMYRDQGLQIPRYEGLEEHVFQTFLRMYAAVERDRHLLPASRFCEVRYEDLVDNPLEQMRKVYDQLELGGFDQALPALREYFAKRADYKTNRFSIPPETRDEINRRWGPFLRQYGYDSEPAQSPATAR
jgi:omega-hydroxy-beta-dihydromenaquinone-9 sulfotransferase